MMRMMCALLLALVAFTAGAESLTWKLRSEHPNVVSASFYSQDRNVAWPGNGQVYILDDYEVHTTRLSCISGETICYGAWVRNRSDIYWGVGARNEHRCSTCCYVCDGGTTPVKALKP